MRCRARESVSFPTSGRDSALFLALRNPESKSDFFCPTIRTPFWPWICSADASNPRVRIDTMKGKTLFSLFESSIGQVLRIRSIPSGSMKTLFIRLGINEGEVVHCFERLPGGTVVIQKNRQQIAIGRKLAKQIIVSQVEERERRDRGSILS